ncbi:uncharacterized protein LOC101462721 isoform X1 [Ceratitis capitata]|uniref:uncharacterized protein LOC101462721 isoform X1 n=1 Tax=Ceratitis capitata TaxID=7213 RepID=UPI000A110074|nr:uncharacterized protein LOC101462721 isoform X1 [Ceratitis capitata]
MSIFEKIIDVEPKAQRIFIYMQLKKVENLPEVDGKLEIHLSQAKNTLTKLEDSYPADNIIDLSKFDEYKPTFSLMVEQDNINDANILSDNPVLITLCNRAMVRVSREEVEEETAIQEAKAVHNENVMNKNKKKQKDALKKADMNKNKENADAGARREHSVTNANEGKNKERNRKSSKSSRIVYDEREEETEMLEEEDESDIFEEQLIPLAQGHIDLLKLYTKKRELSTFYSILYKLSISEKSLGSCTTTWEVYTLLPLLRDMSFHNMVYITFESIFNVRSNLSENTDSLVADLFFESKLPNENNEFEKIKFCTFTNFKEQQITAPDMQLTWETLKSVEPQNIDCIGICTRYSINTYMIFRHLVFAENSKINIKYVNLEDFVVSSNAAHRYVLNEEFVRVLEDVLTFDEQQILVELYRADQANEIIAKGRFDVSILLYPEVTGKRFAVELISTDPKPTSTSKKSSTKSGMANIIDAPTFAIISINFATPLTESFVLQNMEIIPRNILKPIKREKLSARLVANYNFEKEIKKTVFYIIKNNIKILEDAKATLCCHKENITNQIFRLISSDFNTMKPTKDIIEFHNLMTTVYRDTEQTTYNILQKLGHQVPSYIFTETENDIRVINYLTISQYLSMIGDEHFAKMLSDKAEKLSTGNHIFSFFKLIISVEKQDMETANQYYTQPRDKQFELALHLTELIKLYIKYVETLENENTFNQAMENLIVNLGDALLDFPKDICYWVLLHCIFKCCGYLPGIHYTRWKYEHLKDEVEIRVPQTPINRYKLLNSYELNFKNSPKDSLFLKVFKVFINLGLYKFAEFIFKEFEKSCSPFEQYLTQTTLKILSNDALIHYQRKSFSPNKSKGHVEQQLEKALITSINGHLDYNRGDLESAMKSYDRVLMMSNSGIPLLHFSLALLRYGFYNLNMGNYNLAADIFNKCEGKHIKLITKFGLGKALFKMKRLEEAERELAICTTFKVHVPDIWGYLAVINLLQKRNFKALEFWKYAKINPNVEFGKDLQEELANINIYDVELYVDKPVFSFRS